MITDTRNKILEYITDNKQARVYDLQRNLQISRVAIHKQLKKLLKDGLIVRIGTPPVVFYRLNSPLQTRTNYKRKRHNLFTAYCGTLLCKYFTG